VKGAERTSPAIVALAVVLGVLFGAWIAAPIVAEFVGALR
jgi:hypothetical protein